MDFTKKHQNPSPEEHANFCSKIFFCWVLPFFKFSYNNDLAVKDIYNTIPEDLSQSLGDKLEINWNKEILNAEKAKRKPSLKKTIWNTFAKTYMFYGFLICLNTFAIKLTMPIVLGYYIKYFEKTSNQSKRTGWILGSGVIGLAFLNILSSHYTLLACARVGMQVRIACSSLIYRKLLKLNHLSLSTTTAGKLVNFLSNDVIRFDIAVLFLHYLWIMPLLGIGGFIVMYSYIGLAAVPTMIVMSFQAIIGQGYLSKKQGKYRGKIAKLTDERVKLMNEITTGIQVIKMYAWEKPFEKIVELSRRNEIAEITKTSYVKGFSSALTVIVERGTLYIAMISYVLLGQQISGEIVFSMAQLLNTIQLYMSIFFPMALSSYEEAKVSVKRIEDFLLSPEIPALAYSDLDSNSTAIKIIKGRATWLPKPIVHTLIEIDLEILPGSLCCVVGSVGAGKSSLLQVILKELPLNRGKLWAPNKISYAPQEPWLFTGNIRQNILFGTPYDKTRYDEVVEVCALQRDFEELPFGDKTRVGEKGSALSGGQKARVSLARAVYKISDAYLLDDPLSAVDAHVAKHLFEHCIQEYLKDTTRILVTHQLQFLKSADLIVVIAHGRIVKKGTYAELENEIALLSKEAQQNEFRQDEIKAEQETLIEGRKCAMRRRLQSNSSTIIESEAGSEPEETDELIEKGSIPPSTYVTYYRAGNSIFILAILVILVILAQIMCNASDMWVTHWTNIEEEYGRTTRMAHLNYSLLNQTNSTNNNVPVPENVDNGNLLSRNRYYIIIYSVIILLAVILTSIRSTGFYKISMNASIELHNRMFSSIVKAPMAFFDSNPSGRILNRFSKDMGTVDEYLPKCTLDSITIFLVMSGILGMVFIIQPLMIIPAVILGYLFIWARNVYLAAAQDIKRLEGTTKAPVFSHITTTLEGISSIRAYRSQKIIAKEFDNLQDQHTGTWVALLQSSETLGFYLDLISLLFLALVTFQFLIFQSDKTESANVGLVIAHSLILTGMLQFGVRQSAEVAANMTSVERVLQYTNLDEETPLEALPVDKPALGWPKYGAITFNHVYLRYTANGEPSIKDLSFEIRAGEKIGIVGRTGAGKSSLVASLFRLAPVEGRIEIDGIDTAIVGLRALRSSISIIPQTPTLFSASLRYNLDPLMKCSDEQLWQALERVELKHCCSSLDSPVSEGGSNFSIGQRQLICLARAIVRNHKILVMDEATANIDGKTDALIQKAIRREFKDCTVLTIAHRINTIIDCDRVLVMDHGEAVEFAAPHELLEKTDGYFTKMIQQTGSAMENQLRQMAKESYLTKNETKEKNT